MAKQASNQAEGTAINKRIRVPLIGNLQNRIASGSKDQRFINMIPESKKLDQTDGKKIYLFKRGGLNILYSTLPTGEGRGCNYFDGNLYSAVGNKVYKNGDNTGVITLSGSTGNVGMVKGESLSLGQYLFVCDGSAAWIIKDDESVVTVIPSAWAATTNYALNDRVKPTVVNGFWYRVTADAGSSGGSEPTWPTSIGNTVVDGGITWTCIGGSFPTTHIPSPTFLDGYVFLLDNTGDMFNCDVDDPLEWRSDNFINPELFPDYGIALARQNNQVVVLGKTSIEFFYDNGNASGSPLNRYDSGTIQLGCAAPYAVYQNERFLCFISQSESGGRAVWMIDGFQPKKISDEFVERILDSETGISTARGFGIRHGGHLLYVINLPNVNRTLVYDLEEKLWHEWSSNSGGSHIKFRCDYVADDESGKAILLDTSSGKVYKLDPLVYQDASVSILCDVYTTKVDFETNERKFLKKLYVIGDTATSSSNITIYWSDDDYQTWSSGHTIDMNLRGNYDRLGAFRRRAFRLNYTDNYPIRLEALEMEFSLGTS